MRKVFNHGGIIYIVHRKIPGSQMTPRFYGIQNDDTNSMVRLWVTHLKDNHKDIDKVFEVNREFLFCESIKDVEAT